LGQKIKFSYQKNFIYCMSFIFLVNQKCIQTPANIYFDAMVSN
jgi:hypothetical protein